MKGQDTLGGINNVSGDRGRSKLLGFGALHAFNTALNMGFTLLTLLVLARILPLSRYSEVVFLATIGFYLQPIDQAIGRSNFIALQAWHTLETRRGRPEIKFMIAGHTCLVLVLSLAVPSLLQRIGSQQWGEDMLFLFLGLAINMWAFGLQSTAWAIGRNMPFVKISIAQRLLHVVALAIAYATNSFALFVGLSSMVTVVALLVVLRLFATADLMGRSPGASDWPGYFTIFRLSLLATLTDFLTLNAPYALVAMRFGIGPSLVAFDSVMKVARIVMAGARTLAEIALPSHSALVSGGRISNARTMFRKVLGLSFCLSLIPFTGIFFAGGTIFHLLLGRNDVVPLAAMPTAALIVAASGVYQPASFFLSFSNKKGAIRALTAGAFAAMAGFGVVLFATSIATTSLLFAFSVTFVGIAISSACLSDRVFRAPRSVALLEPAVLVNESV